MGLLHVAFAFHHLATANDRAIGALDEALFGGPQGSELREACAPPFEAMLLLLDNAWDRCEVDGVRVVEAPLPGETLVTGDGIGRICPGRHLVVTSLPSGRAVLDRLILPGEVVAVRLDAARGAWVVVDDDEAARVVARVEAREAWLYDYLEHVATPRLATGLARPRSEVLARVGPGFFSLVTRLDAGESPATLAPLVAQLGGMMIGVPLPTLDAITQPVGAAAWQRASAGRLGAARLVTQLGLALLPDAPVLLALLADLASSEGAWEEALSLATRAIDSHHLEGTWVARLEEMRARAPAT